MDIKTVIKEAVMQRKKPFYEVSYPEEHDIELLDAHLGTIQRRWDWNSRSHIHVTPKSNSLHGIPDRNSVRYMHVRMGKTEHKGWGEHFNSLEEIPIESMKTGLLKNHQKVISDVNDNLKQSGYGPVRVKHVTLLYAPQRLFVHMESEGHELGYTNEPKNQVSGRFIHVDDGRPKISASHIPLEQNYMGSNYRTNILPSKNPLSDPFSDEAKVQKIKSGKPLDNDLWSMLLRGKTHKSVLDALDQHPDSNVRRQSRYTRTGEW